VITLRAAGEKETVLSLLRRMYAVKRVSCNGETERGSLDYAVACQPGSDARQALAKVLTDAGIPFLVLPPPALSLEELTERLSRPALRAQKAPETGNPPAPAQRRQPQNERRAAAVPEEKEAVQ